MNTSHPITSIKMRLQCVGFPTCDLVNVCVVEDKIKFKLYLAHMPENRCPKFAICQLCPQQSCITARLLKTSQTITAMCGANERIMRSRVIYIYILSLKKSNESLQEKLLTLQLCKEAQAQ